jgi:Short C-terminal domain
MGSSRVNWIVGGPIVVLFLGGGIFFWVTIPEIWIGQIWVAVSAFLILLYAGIGAAGRRRARLLREGVRGTAAVLSMEQTGVYVNEQPQVRLRLLVEADGIPPYEVERTEIVPLIALGALNQGELAVVVDPDDHETVTIDWGAAAGPMTLGMPDGRVIAVDRPKARQAILAILSRHGVSTDGEISIRDNPAARREVWEALERFGYDVDARTGGPRPAQPAADPSDALRELAEMRDRKLISDAEYERKKQEILARL